MNLLKKKQLAARALRVGKGRIAFSKTHLSEIKEAITKQDMIGLYKDGAITIKNVKGRRKNEKRKKRRGPGKIKKKVNKRKQEYVKMTRKLRKHIGELKKQGTISQGDFIDIRKKIKNRFFKSKTHLKEYIGGLK